MTQKSRRHKAAKRLKRVASQGEQKTFSFYKNNRIVEVVAHDEDEAKAIFMSEHGFYPEHTVQEVLK